MSEHLTDEDTELGSRVARIAVDSFLRRPSMEDRAVNGIARFISNGVMVHPGAPQQHQTLLDAGILYMFRGHARWLISGKSRVYHFEDGKLARASDPAEAPMLGADPDYRPRLEDEFTLTAEKNAFLVCSPMLAERIPEGELEETLAASENPEEWMERLKERAGDVQFCAVALFLPPMRRRLPLWLMVLLALAVIGLVCLLIFK